MVELQIINKILQDKKVDILVNNNITINDFYKHRPEIEFILNHLDKYNVVPDEVTFLQNFKDFEIMQVNESEEYLVNTLLEESTFNKVVPIWDKASKIIETDANEGIRYLLAQIDSLNLKKSESIDLITQASERFKEYENKKIYKAKMVTYTGFKELDKIIEGFSNDGELAVFFARLNNGKSWVVTKVACACWQQGRRVGFYSGEMVANKVGYRIDSILKGFSNRALLKGYDVEGYKEYIEEMKNSKNPIQIITPNDLDGYLTISKLENFIKQYKIEVMIIDQLSLMEDETARGNVQERIKYSHLTKGLKRLSEKYNCPMIVACQANRMGAKNENESGLPEMENLAESDAIGQDATLAISMRIKKNQLEMQVKKYRDGMVGNKFVYALDLDHGKFTYLPDDNSTQENIQQIEETRSKFDDGKEIDW